eukprot:4799702-Amphidinium_carterae.1
MCERKNRQQYHKKGGLKQQSVTQIDYAYIRGDIEWDYNRSWICNSGTKKRRPYDSIKAIRRFIKC